MANIKSAKKRIKVIAAKTLQNKMVRTSLKNTIKRFEKAIAAGDKALIPDLYKKAVKRIDQAAAKGLLHKNTAARKKSRFTKIMNKAIA